ncbi:MAG: hypothetical protein NG740_06040 [Omnitrophica bacterium]|nr:hypothetical protein [Candidatus Omnitrophota bacterium]
MKTKSIENIEQKMKDVDETSLRYLTLQNAKHFKTSWIELGQTLYTVWKDKLYRNWGYGNFDAYTIKEIGIRKQTALKLLRSYRFLEHEDPRYVSKDYTNGAPTPTVPTYESVNELRLARAKKDIPESDYEDIKKKVLEKGGDAREVKKDLAAIIKRREELEPREAWQKRKIALLKRFLGVLKSARREIGILKILPAQIIKDADNLIRKLETEISN